MSLLPSIKSEHDDKSKKSCPPGLPTPICSFRPAFLLSNARRKSLLITNSLWSGPRICDLTGGLGIDSWQLSQQAEELIYIERFAEYCRAAEHNFKTLGATNIQILEADVREIVSTLTADTFYIDPARRTECNRRVFALSDCEPDVLQFKNILLPKAGRLILKTSPMADISETLRQLPETTEVHIIAVRNECKEVIFVLENTVTSSPRIRVVTINYTSDGQQQVFSFPWQKEKNKSISSGRRNRRLPLRTECRYSEKRGFQANRHRIQHFKIAFEQSFIHLRAKDREFSGTYF